MKFKLIVFAIAFAAATMLLFAGAFASAVAKEFESTKQQLTIEESPYDSGAEAYREIVITMCSKYGFSEYSDIVLKMISIYSDTHMTDVLNASFSYLNTKYEHKNEGITSPEYSIETGVAQLSEWADYIIKNYKLNPLNDEKALLVLLQAYEFQDKGYIDYAIEKGYTPSGAVKYCSSKSFQSEKSSSNIGCNFAALVNNLVLPAAQFPGESGELEDWQKKVVSLALDYNNYSKKGIRTQGGYCLRFTNDVYQAAGLSIVRSDTAWLEGKYFGVSNDWSSIPVGAQIYCTASQSAGHVGIYIGDGMVVHCSTYKSSDATLLKYASNPYGYVIKQPLKSFISSYHAKCWGFSGAMSGKYPYQSGRYM